ncbi:MAG: hypothetical protein U5N56_12260 [Candidatus Marinimicrobia bacterium]|nr:hypothetical protein [Candidatus Neomarinimicrobiota bacterium]
MLVLQLLDPREWELPEARKYRFRDMESGEDIKLDVRQIREEYKTKIREFTGDINRRCGENGIDHSLILTDRDCRTALLEFLKKRRRLY